MRLTPVSLATVSLAALALAACQPKTETAPAAETAASGQEATAAPENTAPAMKPLPFEALSKTAESFTGNITLQALPPAGPDAAPIMRLEGGNGLVYQTELVAGGAASAPAVKWSEIFNTPIDVTAEPANGAPSIDIHAVKLETVPATATNGGFCGKEKTGYIAMAIPLELIGGVQMMSLAAFSGDQWPPKSEASLCGTFNYALPAPPQ